LSDENKHKNVKTVEVTAVYKKGFIGPVKIEVRPLTEGEEVALGLDEGIKLAGRIAKEAETHEQESEPEESESSSEPAEEEGSHD